MRIHTFIPILLLFLLSPSSSHASNAHHHHPHPAVCSEKKENLHHHHPHPNVQPHHPHPAVVPNIPQPAAGQNKNPVIASVCARTRYPDICTTSAQSQAKPATPIDGPAAVLTLLTNAVNDLTTVARNKANNAVAGGGLGVLGDRIVYACKKNFDDALGKLENVKAAAARRDKHGASYGLRDAVADYNVCAMSLMEMPGGGPFARECEELEKMGSNCLAVVEMV